MKDPDLLKGRWRNLRDWHDTGLWNTNEKTYSFIKSIVATDDAQEPASERLIRIQANRPCMSWIKLYSHSPDRGEYLSVLTSYSGTLNLDPSVKLNRYYFRNPVK